MIETAFAQLRLAYALATGRRLNLRDLDRITAAMCETLSEFGYIGAEAARSVSGPVLDGDVAKQVALKRFRTQVKRAAEGTRYYGDLFARIGLDPDRFGTTDIADVPITTKDALRADPMGFVHDAARPTARIGSTATTGRATTVHYSDYELRVISALTAHHMLLRRLIEPEDVVALCISSRASLALNSIISVCSSVGAVSSLVGLVDPREALTALTASSRPPTVLNIYPSYLGELIEVGLAAGLRPRDFALERILVGGEVVTSGLQRRAVELFGDVDFSENCAMTEIAPAGGTPCTGGHLHLEPTTGLVEVERLDGTGPADPGEAGTLIVTPFPPYRETTLLLRYDTGDVVRPLAGPLTCELNHLPATSRIEGKRSLGVEHDHGWTFQRPVQEALESLSVVPLPARYGVCRTPGGVGVDVVVRQSDRHTAAIIRQTLVDQGVPVTQVNPVPSLGQLRAPVPVRAELREFSFGVAS